MYYGYNSFTGRLIGANRMKAYAPQAAPTQGSAGQAGAVRAASGATAAHGSSYGKVPERILRIRAKLQKAEHLPVHLKGGTFDFALFYLTAALAVTGLVGAVATILKLSVPQKPADS